MGLDPGHNILALRRSGAALGAGIRRGAGTVRGVHIQNVRRLALGEPLTRVMDYQGTLALDGEREIFFRPGDEITCAVTRNGPLRVDARRAIEYARTHGCFQL